jgi:hypothetical protein
MDRRSVHKAYALRTQDKDRLLFLHYLFAQHYSITKHQQT